MLLKFLDGAAALCQPQEQICTQPGAPISILVTSSKARSAPSSLFFLVAMPFAPSSFLLLVVSNCLHLPGSKLRAPSMATKAFTCGPNQRCPCGDGHWGLGHWGLPFSHHVDSTKYDLSFVNFTLRSLAMAGIGARKANGHCVRLNSRKCGKILVNAQDLITSRKERLEAKRPKMLKSLSMSSRSYRPYQAMHS